MTMNEALALLWAFEQAATAGYGYRVGCHFYAIPGLEDAAADAVGAGLLDFNQSFPELAVNPRDTP